MFLLSLVMTVCVLGDQCLRRKCPVGYVDVTTDGSAEALKKRPKASKDSKRKGPRVAEDLMYRRLQESEEPKPKPIRVQLKEAGCFHTEDQPVDENGFIRGFYDAGVDFDEETRTYDFTETSCKVCQQRSKAGCGKKGAKRARGGKRGFSRAESELEAEDDMSFAAGSALEPEDVEGYADGVVFAVSPLFVYSFAAFTLFVWTAFVYCCYVQECKGKKVKKVSVYDVDSENEVLNANAA